jgi:lipoyl(octanoyl) transferase
VTYHGIALNITTNLDDFALIDPCGMPDAQATSIAIEAGWPSNESQPSTASVAKAADRFAVDFAERLDEASATHPLAVGAGV